MNKVGSPSNPQPTNVYNNARRSNHLSEYTILNATLIAITDGSKLFPEKRRSVKDETAVDLNRQIPKDFISQYRHRKYNNLDLQINHIVHSGIEKFSIYGGVIGPQFGHAITQSLGRLWVASRFPNAEILFAPANDRVMQIPSYFIQLLSYLGINNPIRLVNQDTWIPNLVVPRDICNIDKRPCVTKEFLNWITLRRPYVAIDNDVSLYISRSAMPLHSGQFLQETLIEDILRGAGYTVVHPEKISIAEQALLYAQAKRIIFADGSACHLWSLFAQQGQSVGIILRRPINRYLNRWFKSMNIVRPAFMNFVLANLHESEVPNYYKSVALLDIESLWEGLRDLNFHNSPGGPTSPSAHLTALISAVSTSGNFAPLDCLDERSCALIEKRRFMSLVDPN